MTANIWYVTYTGPLKLSSISLKCSVCKLSLCNAKSIKSLAKSNLPMSSAMSCWKTPVPIQTLKLSKIVPSQCLWETTSEHMMLLAWIQISMLQTGVRLMLHLPSTDKWLYSAGVFLRQKVS